MSRVLRVMLRRARGALLPVLLVLIAAHLAAATHGPAFAGPHSVLGAAPAHHVSNGPGALSLEPPPSHQHNADEHIDHAVDRPRSAATALAVPAPAAVFGPDRERLSAACALCGGPPSCADGPPGSGADLALHCVWRQ